MRDGRARWLWTGRYGSALRDRALAEAPGASGDAPALWIVPTPLARDGLTWRLAARGVGRVGSGHEWLGCWDDLWLAVRAQSSRGPARLSEAGQRAALREAIDRARRQGSLRAVARVVGLAGFRRQLRARFAAWTRAEWHRRAELPRAASPIEAEQQVIFRHYRDVLGQVQAEDDEGLAVWASKRLASQTPPPAWRAPGFVGVLDLTAMSPAQRRALRAFNQRAEAMLVTLPYDPDPALGEVFADLDALRQTFRDWGFDETPRDDGPGLRPPSLVAVERALFRTVGPPEGACLLSCDDDGLTVLGAPRGEGQATLLARRVRDLLDQGAAPDEILVLVRAWDEQALVMRAALRGWGIPVTATLRHPLASEPAVSALRRAMNLPVQDWESAEVIPLLRHSQVRLAGLDPATPHALAGAASAIQASRVFRGRDALLQALDRAVASAAQAPDDPGRRHRAEQARTARPILERLIALVESLARPGPWPVQVARLRHLADGLGLFQGAPADRDPLDHLFNTLDDHGEVLDRLGRGEAVWSWADFAHEVDALVADLVIPEPSARSEALDAGSVRLATVDEAEGVRASHLILANLAEGTFPVPEAVDPGPNGDPDDPAAEGGTGPGRIGRAFAREMRRFLRVVGSADASLTLLYPTTDEKGQTLLVAGFLDDLLRRLTPEARARFPRPIRRLDPTLKAHDTLAGSPRDARVLAVARAFHRPADTDDGDSALRKLLAANPEAHREPLAATASALRVAHLRLHRRAFGPYDGRLADRRAIARIAQAFAADRHDFSPSQLESLVHCPFQFFARYVLHLEPVEDRDELEDDPTVRGSRVHRLLETLHLSLRDAPGDGPDALIERVRDELTALIDRELDRDGTLASEIEAGLRDIEALRLRQTAQRYAEQLQAYLDRHGTQARCEHVEVVFGARERYQSLVLGHGPHAVRLQGKIDRIDLIQTPDWRRFRVIDYKTGHCPKATEVRQGLWLQLPLYALAVERLVLTTLADQPHDLGYWDLGQHGFTPIDLNDAWETFRQALEAYVVDLASQMRRGAFPIHPRRDRCTQVCDYRSVCRIGQLRPINKPWPEQPTLALPAPDAGRQAEALPV